MSALLLRLVGPMQSWGTQSRFSVRDTGLEPSKSGVLGLVCAAMGRLRSDSVDDLASLKMAVRVDAEGTTQVDYHTAGGTHRKGEDYGVYKASGDRPDTVTSNRYYLADADFLVALEGEHDLLSTIDGALARPVWQLYLGRKSFVPGVSVREPAGLLEDRGAAEALRFHPWPRPGIPVPEPGRRPRSLRLLCEVLPGSADDAACELRSDQPIGRAFLERTFALRQVMTTFLELSSQVPIREA